VTGEAVGFVVVSVVLLGASLQVVLSTNLFHSVLWLALALVATAGLFLLLHAEFLAAAQLLLYAGGVVTIVVFAIMLTERLAGESIRQMNRGIGWGTVVAVGVFASVGGVVLRAPGRTRRGPRRRPRHHGGAGSRTAHRLGAAVRGAGRPARRGAARRRVLGQDGRLAPRAG
jgi:NADH:ubiquinone oxidoreductase subunit 6 (subunit J)